VDLIDKIQRWRHETKTSNTKKTAKGFSNITDLVDLKPIYNKKGSNYADIFGFSLCTPACSTFLNFFSN